MSEFLDLTVLLRQTTLHEPCVPAPALQKVKLTSTNLSGEAKLASGHLGGIKKASSKTLPAVQIGARHSARHLGDERNIQSRIQQNKKRMECHTHSHTIRKTHIRVRDQTAGPQRLA